MNDTETEARRLFAAATRDMPPGIDLLDGFVAARRRDRARRMRRGAVLSAGIAVAAASVTALTLTIRSAPPALAAVTSALTRTLTQSYHLTDEYSSYYIRNGQVTDRGHSTCASVADPARHLQASSCSNRGFDSREVGRYTYSYSSVPADGRHWDRIPTACLGHVPAIGGFITAKPQQMLVEIKKAEKVTVVGPVSGPGWTGTRYAFSSSLAPPTRIKLSGTVTVDQQGRARALALTIRSTNRFSGVFVMTHVLTFSGFRAPVTVTPPPADQTFSTPC